MSTVDDGNDELGMTLSDIISIDADTPEFAVKRTGSHYSALGLPGPAMQPGKKGRRNKQQNHNHGSGSRLDAPQSIYDAWGGNSGSSGSFGNAVPVIDVQGPPAGKGGHHHGASNHNGHGGYHGDSPSGGKGNKGRSSGSQHSQSPRGGKGRNSKGHADKGWGQRKKEEKKVTLITCAGCNVKIPANQAVGHASQCNRLAQTSRPAGTKSPTPSSPQSGSQKETFTSAYSLFIAKKLEGVKMKRGGVAEQKWKEMSPAEKFQDLADRNRTLKESLLQRMTDATSEWEAMSFAEKRPFIEAARKNQPTTGSTDTSPKPSPPSSQGSPTAQQRALQLQQQAQALSAQQHAQQQQLYQLQLLQQQQNMLQMQMVQQGLQQGAMQQARMSPTHQANRSDPMMGMHADMSAQSLEQLAAKSMDDIRVGWDSLSDISMRNLSASCPQMIVPPAADSSAAQLAALALYLNEVGLVPSPRAPTHGAQSPMAAPSPPVPSPASPSPAGAKARRRPAADSSGSIPPSPTYANITASESPRLGKLPGGAEGIQALLAATDDSDDSDDDVVVSVQRVHSLRPKG